MDQNSLMDQNSQMEQNYLTLEYMLNKPLILCELCGKENKGICWKFFCRAASACIILATISTLNFIYQPNGVNILGGWCGWFSILSFCVMLSGSWHEEDSFIGNKQNEK